MEELIIFAKNLAVMVNNADEYDCQILYRNSSNEPRGYTKIDKVYLREDTNLATNYTKESIILLYHGCSEAEYSQLSTLKKDLLIKTVPKILSL